MEIAELEVTRSGCDLRQAACVAHAAEHLRDDIEDQARGDAPDLIHQGVVALLA